MQRSLIWRIWWCAQSGHGAQTQKKCKYHFDSGSQGGNTPLFVFWLGEAICPSMDTEKFFGTWRYWWFLMDETAEYRLLQTTQHGEWNFCDKWPKKHTCLTFVHLFLLGKCHYSNQIVKSGKCLQRYFIWTKLQCSILIRSWDMTISVLPMELGEIGCHRMGQDVVP